MITAYSSDHISVTELTICVWRYIAIFFSVSNAPHTMTCSFTHISRFVSMSLRWEMIVCELQGLPSITSVLFFCYNICNYFMFTNKLLRFTWGTRIKNENKKQNLTVQICLSHAQLREMSFFPLTAKFSHEEVILQTQWFLL